MAKWIMILEMERVLVIMIEQSNGVVKLSTG